MRDDVAMPVLSRPLMNDAWEYTSDNNCRTLFQLSWRQAHQYHGRADPIAGTCADTSHRSAEAAPAARRSAACQG